MSLVPLASDNFTRPNENPLSDRGKWTNINAPIANAGPLQVLSDLCVTTKVSATCAAVWTGFSWSNDQYSQVTWYKIVISPNDYLVINVRSSSSTNTSINSYQANLTNNTWNMYKWVSGSLTQFASGTATFKAGDIFKLQAIGQTISLWQNGIQLNSLTDSSISAGSPAFGIHEPTIGNNAVSLWVGGGIPPLPSAWINRHRNFINKR
jgi:hypothetical protein